MSNRSSVQSLDGAVAAKALSFSENLSHTPRAVLTASHPALSLPLPGSSDIKMAPRVPPPPPPLTILMPSSAIKMAPPKTGIWCGDIYGLPRPPPESLPIRPLRNGLFMAPGAAFRIVGNGGRGQRMAAGAGLFIDSGGRRGGDSGNEWV